MLKTELFHFEQEPIHSNQTMRFYVKATRDLWFLNYPINHYCPVKYKNYNGILVIGSEAKQSQTFTGQQ